MISAVSATGDNNDTNLCSDLTDDSVKDTINSQTDKTSSTNDAIIKEDPKLDKESKRNYAIINENKDSKKLSSNRKENEILKNDEPKSFKELDNSIICNLSSGEYTINLKSNYKYMEDSDSEELKNGVVIGKEYEKITIDGNGHTIDGSNIARIFHILSNDVTLKNITFINGNREEDGGAIYWEGNNGYIDSCNFNNNHAKKGGAIYWGDSVDGTSSNPYNAKNGTVIRSNFTDNRAMSGGAIFWFSNEGKIIDSNFNNNNASNDGGAIQWNGDNGTIIDSDFTNNWAKDLAGAVYWQGDYGNITNNCNFINNTACCDGIDTEELGGGAIYWFGNNGAIRNYCSFINNTAKPDEDSNPQIKGGGAIHFINDINYVSECIFINNNASNHGGAIWCKCCVVSNCIFLNNTADYGDTIYSNKSLKAEYNWFGHNVSNYKEEPLPLSGIYECNIWLFLNATSNPDNVTVSGKSNITFKLKYYKTDNEISDYDANRLYPVNLKVSPKLGSVDKKIAHLNESILYTAPNIAGSDSVTASIENAAYTINLNIKEGVKTDIKNISISSLFEGKIGTVNGTLYANDEVLPNQKITINITNTQGNQETYNGNTDNKGKFSITIKPTINGEANIIINYKGNQTDKYIFKPTSKTINQYIALKTSLKYLNQEIQNATKNNINNLSLNNDYKYDPNTDSDLKYGIVIDRKFTIYGNNQIIDGDKQSRIFFVTGNGDLTLENITLSNGQGQNETIEGYNTNVGGAIYANDSTSLTIINCKFTNNTATEPFGEGGAIYTGHNTLININNTTFNNNSAKIGGAILINIDSTLNINNTKLTQNNAYSNGGAIVGNINSTINMNNTTLTNNTATYGGAITTHNSTLNINNTTLTNNTAYYDGGAIYKHNSTLNINNTTLTNNTANNGGAIAALNSQLKITNSELNNNNAYNDGGAICISNSQLKITNSELNNNNAYYDCGAIFISNSQLEITNSELNNNSAYYAGGAILINMNSTLNINNTTLTNNTAIYGGAIYTDNSQANINNTTLTNNTAIYGGAIYNYNTSQSNIANTIFNNKANKNGGAINAEFNSKTNIISSIFTNNTAHEEGGAIYTHNSNINISNSEFNSNTAINSDGGAIQTKSEAIINDCKFIGNIARDGGAINIFNSTITINNATFMSNTANRDAGAIGVYVAGNISITDSNFIGNTANRDGGAISLEEESQLKINNTTFNNNKANKNGGALYATNDLSITNSVLQNNKANKGSGVYIVNGTLTTINTKFINNDVDGENYHIKHKDSQLRIETIPNTLEGTILTIKLNADPLFNDKVTLIINQDTYTVEIINGHGQISISNLKPGTYVTKIIFPGNENYTEITLTSNSFKINAKPVTPTKTKYKVKIYLTLKKVKQISKNVKKLYLKVVVKRDGKKLTTKTITLKIKRKKTKTKKTSKTKKSKKTSKTKKSTKVQNFKFKIKINKQTYTQKTNKKGKATYTVTNIYKKGKYTVKISYHSKYYTKISKTIKIKIKE